MSESALGQGLVEELGEKRAAEIMGHLHAEIAQAVKRIIEIACSVECHLCAAGQERYKATDKEQNDWSMSEDYYHKNSPTDWPICGATYLLTRLDSIEALEEL